MFKLLIHVIVVFLCFIQVSVHGYNTNYQLTSALFARHQFDTRPYIEIYQNIQTWRANHQLRQLANIPSDAVNKRHQLFWANFFWDNFLLEALLITPIHEIRHAEVGVAYGADSIGFYGIFPLIYGEFSNTQSAHICGSGVNLHTNLARKAYMGYLTGSEEWLFLNSSYISNKAGSMVYGGLLPFGDPYGYVHYMNKAGINIKRRDLVPYYILSTMFSGGFIHSIRSSQAYLCCDESSIKPLSFSGNGVEVFWPEFSVFLNPTNVSVLSETMVQSLEGEKHGVLIGIEHGVMGKSVPTEVTLGVNYRRHPVTFLSMVSFNNQTDYFFQNMLNYKWSPTYHLIASYKTGNLKTQRQIREWFFSRDILELGVKFQF